MPSTRAPAPAKTNKAAATRAAAVARKAAAKPPPSKAGSAPPGAVVAAPAKPPKQKLVRDSFAMPGADFELIHLLKERALSFRRPAKKSELLRAGLHALAALSGAQLRLALDSLAPLKPGRPKNAG